MAQAKVFDASSGKVSSEDVDVSSLGELTRRKLLRTAVLRHQANQRQGTHSTKTRAEVSRTGRKPYRQKGTGRARAGDFSSPIWKGGGVAFGPRPRSYRTSMPVRARREALRSALLTKYADGEVAFVRQLSWDTPSTKNAVSVLQSLEMTDGALVVLPERNDAVYRSFRNLPRVDVLPAAEVNAFHVLNRRGLILVGSAMDVIQGRLGQAPAPTAEEAADAD